MDANSSEIKKNSLVAAVLFAVVFVIESLMLIKNFDTDTNRDKILSGSLTVLFAILAVQNYVKYKRTED